MQIPSKRCLVNFEITIIIMKISKTLGRGPVYVATLFSSGKAQSMTPKQQILMGKSTMF